MTLFHKTLCRSTCGRHQKRTHLHLFPVLATAVPMKQSEAGRGNQAKKRVRATQACVPCRKKKVQVLSLLLHARLTAKGLGVAVCCCFRSSATVPNQNVYIVPKPTFAASTRNAESADHAKATFNCWRKGLLSWNVV